MHTGNHWVTISNVNNNPNYFYIYDSLLDIRESTLANIKPTIRQLFSTHFYNCNFFIINNSQQQSNGNDCGLFSLAFAEKLVEKKNPLAFSFKNLRHYFNYCADKLEIGYFAGDHIFPIPSPIISKVNF